MPHLVATAEEKQALGLRHAALAVDMEAATVAQFCQRHGVPFGSVRAISDDMRTTVSPQLATVLRAGRVSLPRILAALVRRPSLAPELMRFARQTRLAGQRLATALGELLTLTLPWMSGK